MQLLNDVTHQIYIMCSTSPVMANRAGHAVIQRLINHADRKLSLFTLVNIRVIQHNPVAVKPVYQDILVPFPIIIADNRHRVAILLNTII